MKPTFLWHSPEAAACAQFDSKSLQTSDVPTTYSAPATANVEATVTNRHRMISSGVTTEFWWPPKMHPRRGLQYG